MKKILVVIGAIAAVLIGNFYYKNLRGIGPAINPPPKDISKEITQESRPSSKNSSGLPLSLPSGFSLLIFAKNLDGPRVLAWDPKGTLLVSIPSQGKVVALPDTNNDGISDETVTVVEDLNRPHGLAFRLHKLYVAETNQVAMYDYDEITHKATGKHKLFDLPAGGNHVTRTIAFGPDEKLYTSIGSSCNACIEKDWQRAKILVSNTDGNDLKVFASGLRNAVFFRWSPIDSHMWATVMGRDLLGDDLPPDSIDIISEGKNYGWPYCYGKQVWDKTFDASEEASDFCKTTEPSTIDLQAHSAPLGLAFIPNSWPAEYRGDLLVSYHGSWNRSVPTGYKIVRIKLDGRGNYESTEDFITGWLSGASSAAGALGRPVDLLFDSKGNLFISDDKAEVIYKLAVTQK